ncbi:MULTISPECIES: PLP-dependent aminotransferase family protein [Bacillus]|uniref:PLP-dependent aminotransferase family protein n=1 Tax=Bacillus glycinifermentans TaxID=1664069 RepID=A0AAJ3YZM5_9BACI|nr:MULTISPECIES: PLP-dependent aminotransferase family protein [Bacillus]HWO78250.1 PLP-dependent aminotransferase family protein [Bacillus sp. (in: firmicutes)]KKB73084.1 GntR family transcriptional regulator [Bacillus sp. TH008]MDU0070720.1 PLP-dependent aminotransferase family protein [Bacillus sp. IG6]MED8018708.1 PLP-dependent aminotransferase family protein [Bacillus glycinifermentans]QAT66141.1 PLP-dependent aminotransferase family protein [Bacillus glycinifermentans]
MDWKPNRADKTPIYKQIANYIEQGISSGVFSPDSVLPSERALANELQVNRSTVVAAYEVLQSLGLVERKRGSGTRISTDIWGISHKRIPNWTRYVEDGSFLPNLPLVQRIRTETQKNNLINLASGELTPRLFPTDQFRTILSDHPFMGHLGYDHPLGNVILRETIASHVKEYKDIDTSSSSILITSGAQQALHLIVQCLLKPGDAVAIEDPSYCFSLPLFKSAGLRTFLLPVDEDGFNPDDLISLHKKHRIRMVFLNPDHQNPTGTVLSLERRKKVLELSAKFGIPIIEDDPYSLTTFDGNVHPTLKTMDHDRNILYISSLSKIIASGLRIGWVIGPPQVIQRLADAKQQVDFGHSVFPQWIANEFLGSTHFGKHISMLRKELKYQRDEITASLEETLSGETEFFIPEGGIHVWCKLNSISNEYHLLEESMRRGVAFVPGSILGSKKGYVRFTFGRGERHLIREGISRFADALKSIQLNR